MTIPAKYVGLIIGKQGNRIKEMQKESNTNLVTPAKGEGTFKIFGDKYNVKAVINLLTTLAKEYEKKDEEKNKCHRYN